jgi:hypothetical protein
MCVFISLFQIMIRYATKTKVLFSVHDWTLLRDTGCLPACLPIPVCLLLHGGGGGGGGDRCSPYNLLLAHLRDRRRTDRPSVHPGRAVVQAWDGSGL